MPYLVADLEHLARYRWAVAKLKEINRHSPVRTVLDLACGRGHGTRLLREAGFDARGFDLAEEVARQARAAHGEFFVVSDIRHLPVADGSADAVVCFDVLEHLREPERAMREAARVLCSDGAYTLSVINAAVTILAGLHPLHVREYTAEQIIALLALSGFAQIEVYGQSLTVAREGAPVNEQSWKFVRGDTTAPELVFLTRKG